MYYNTLKNYLGEYNIIVINNKDVGIFAVDESYKGESYISEISLNRNTKTKGLEQICRIKYIIINFYKNK